MNRWSDATLTVDESRAEAQAWCTERGLDPHLVPVGGWLEEDPHNPSNVRVLTFIADPETGGVVFNQDLQIPMMTWVNVIGPLPAEHLIEEVGAFSNDPNDWAQALFTEPQA